MSIKKTVMKQGMKLMSDPRVLKLMQDERVMRAMMGAMAVPGRVQSFTEEQRSAVQKIMGVASEREVKDLERTIRSLEDQLSELKKRSNEKLAPASPAKTSDRRKTGTDRSLSVPVFRRSLPAATAEEPTDEPTRR
jgi:hypothetical protein